MQENRELPIKPQLSYRILFLSLGVNPKLIPEDLDYQKAYKTFSLPMQFFVPQVTITETWPLLFFCPDPTAVAALESHQLKKDGLENTALHFAAWSGCIAALNWARDNGLDLFKINKYGYTIAHYVAMSNNLEALQWIKENCPELLSVTDKDGCTIAHFAAKSDNVDALRWIKENCPELLSVIDKDRCSIALFACGPGNMDALHWVKKYCPELLTVPDNDGCDITHYAAWSGNITCLKEALLLSQSPREFSLPECTRVHEIIMTTLLNYLETDYTLTTIHNLDRLKEDEPRKSLVENLLKRNRAIKQAKMKFIPFMQDFSESYDCLPVEAQIALLQQQLPAGVNTMQIYQSLQPKARAIFVIQDEIRRLLSVNYKSNVPFDEIRRRLSVNFRISGQFKFNDRIALSDRIAALSDLIARLESQKGNTSETLTQWKQDNMRLFGSAGKVSFFPDNNISGKRSIQCMAVLEEILVESPKVEKNNEKLHTIF
ncbi:ankyrin repeat domain-containing protein [Legionella maioricensis]|uniref:Ankyrin repeat domain-containing protein n=1 Tax=Legionella maioricensis TaxID=2896528 RepID=A0A9X2D308_9GAMM|nr:ankyrin repeat domain-containing protein [Legionella maioricensis]MCL9685308.1 ankyrin repeat domain-containing protein [Legionella maioricensis]MCL9688563.1 ankyrin repeat domain-containing protein [Legionella maioricensis]